MRDIRFLFDEHIHPAVAENLRRRGVDLLTAKEAGLLTLADTAYLELARATGRVIVTHDRGFVRWSRENTEHPGIAFCEMNSRTIGQLIDGLERIWSILEPDDIAGQVKFL